MPDRLASSSSGPLGPGSSASAAPEAATAISHVTRVVRSRDLVGLISAHANPGAQSMPVDTWWSLETARTAATLRGIHPRFAALNSAYADEAFARLEHGKLKPKALLTEFMLRLAGARLPAKYPASEGKRAELARQMAKGMREHTVSHANIIDIAIAVLLDVAYGTRPPPAPAENIHGDPEWAKAIVHADTLRYCLHTFLSGLATGTHDLKKLEALARRCARLTDEKRGVWYCKLAFFAAQAGAWRTVKLLLDASKLPPDMLGEPYEHTLGLIDTRDQAGSRDDLIAQHEPEDGEYIGLLHLAAAQDEVSMLAYLYGHLTSAGVSIDYEDGGTESALFHAVQHGKRQAFEWLIRHGAQVDARLGDGSTLLHTAAETSPAAVRLVIEAQVEAKADVNAVNNDRQSPLALATHPESVVLLCKAGANVANTDKYHISILERWINQFDRPPRVDLILALHSACTTPAQLDGFRQMLSPAVHPQGGQTSPLLLCLELSPLWNQVSDGDGSTLLHRLDQAIALVRLFMKEGADPHLRNSAGASAYLIGGGFQSVCIEEIKRCALAEGSNAKVFTASVKARSDTLRQLLGWPAGEAVAATQTGKRKRVDGA